jgi:hypothetical protein
MIGWWLLSRCVWSVGWGVDMRAGRVRLGGLIDRTGGGVARQSKAKLNNERTCETRPSSVLLLPVLAPWSPCGSRPRDDQLLREAAEMASGVVRLCCVLLLGPDLLLLAPLQVASARSETIPALRHCEPPARSQKVSVDGRVRLHGGSAAPRASASLCLSSLSFCPPSAVDRLIIREVVAPSPPPWRSDEVEISLLSMGAAVYCLAKGAGRVLCRR